MHVPIGLALALPAILGATLLSLGLMLAGRNPLPFPDRGSLGSSPRCHPKPSRPLWVSLPAMASGSDSR
jgi:hypothetical protein